jgi:hypothetical protein
MVDRRHAEEFLGRLPRDDPFRMLEEITFWVKALRDAYGIVPQRAFEVLDVLDVTAKAPQRTLTSDFIALGSRYQKFQAQRTWNTSFQFSRELGATYQYLVDQYRKRTSGSELLRPVLPVIVARAIRALRLELKWSLLRQGPVDQVLWKLAGALYSYAEESKFATDSLKVYPGAPELSSVQQEYLQALMLAVSATDTLLPENLHLVDFLIEHYAGFFALVRTPRRGCHYYVDVANANAPARLVDRVAPAPGIRYFGPDKAAKMLDRMIESISERGMVPPEINPDGMHKAASILEALDHVARYWDLSPPTRASERKTAVTRISVVHGFASILTMVSGDSQDLDFDSNVETWRVENESQGGYGAVITETASDWLEIGSLLGIREEEGASWGIGLVRRLVRPAAGTMYVGIESLSRGAVKATVSMTSGPARRELSALLLPSSSEGSAHSAEVVLMLPPGTFVIGQTYAMHTFGRVYPLLPREVREKGEGYELARFRVQPAQAANRRS